MKNKDQLNIHSGLSVGIEYFDLDGNFLSVKIVQSGGRDRIELEADLSQYFREKGMARVKPIFQDIGPFIIITS